MKNLAFLMMSIKATFFKRSSVSARIETAASELCVFARINTPPTEYRYRHQASIKKTFVPWNINNDVCIVVFPAESFQIRAESF